MPVHLPRLDIVPQIAADLGKPAARIDVAGPWGSSKTLLAVQAAEALERPLLVLTSGRLEAEGVLDDLTTFAGTEPVFFPAWEVLPTDHMSPSDDIVAERMHALQTLCAAGAEGIHPPVVCPVRALLQGVIAPERLGRGLLTLEVGEEHLLEELADRLVDLGYVHEVMVEGRGQFSVRGGILDLFPVSAELPYRIEFFGDEIESIRRFEPETQRSVEHVERAVAPPRSERALLHETGAGDAPLGMLLDYLPAGVLVALDEPLAIHEEAIQILQQVDGSPYFHSWDAVESRLNAHQILGLAQVAQAPADGVIQLRAPIGAVSGWDRGSDGFWKQLTQWDADGYTVTLLCNNSGERKRLLELLEEHGYRLDRDRFDLRVGLGRLRAGFVSHKDKLAVLSDREMFGRHYVRRARRRFEAGASITTFSDLRPGDYVVHVDHGIGRYLGLRRFSGRPGDYLTLEYSGGDKLYVPVTHIDLVQKYTGGDGTLPKTDKIGGASWAKKKARVKKALKDMTDELVKLYAARESLQGHAYQTDTHWQEEFEDEFPYEETPDQRRAIDEVKRDMEQPKPMDRLVCGDVGYGKTEVAIRAAFKAVLDGKQVAVLVPTTVLAEQHYETFIERTADYPVEVAMLSRFRSSAEIKTSVERMKSGEVDIVVGTHRLLSKDIQFKNLGLVIIDEEQRFGVAHKEKLKQLRQLVDVLTLTATPIPRTLNLALMGVRDMSIINTAPNDRLPVHTCIEPFDERLVQEAIERELSRQGQVFFVHNRVQTIDTMVELVRKLVPSARVAVGHGQMPERQLETVMSGFVRHEVDVLVCTTIIGSGIDIPNANTIIINNADQFGLAELYQLRGRVGRYKHRAFAYLLVPGERALSEEAQQRLKALEEFSALGSGFRIAMRDLEIRGSGNILGGEQHGQIAAVGYDTYIDLIAETVAEIKGEPVKTVHLPPFDIAVDAYIPEEYVPSETQKLTLYKRVAGVRSAEELDELLEEMADRFGPVPAPVRRLVDVMRVRALGAEVGAQRIAAGKDSVSMEFDSGRLLNRSARNVLVQQFGNRLEFSWQNQPGMTFKLDGEASADPIKTAERLLKALAEV